MKSIYSFFNHHNIKNILKRLNSFIKQRLACFYLLLFCFTKLLSKKLVYFIKLLSKKLVYFIKNISNRMHCAIIRYIKYIYKLIYIFYIQLITLKSAIFGKSTQPMVGQRILMLTISMIRNDPRINKEAASLAEAGFEVDILCYDSDFNAPPLRIEDVSPGVRYVWLPIYNCHDNISCIYQYQKSFHLYGLRFAYSAVHAHDLTTLRSAWLISRDCGIPLVYDAHEMWSENVRLKGQNWVPLCGFRRILVGWQERFLVHYASIFISVSNSICDEYLRRYKLKERPLLLPNTPELRLLNIERNETDNIRSQAGLNDGHFITLYIGGINPLRNIENVLLAHTLLPDNYVFIIRGPGVSYYANEYEALAQKLDLKGRFFCLPEVGRHEVVNACLGADCGIVMLRNLCKNFYWFYPNKFFEYMLAGLPVASSNFPDVSVHLEKEQCGVTFDPDDPASIAEALKLLGDDREKACLMGQNGYQGVLARYNWEHDVKLLVEAYRQLSLPPVTPPTRHIL
jgi:glycosyltransferase involved in cell wall biosynthesis